MIEERDVKDLRQKDGCFTKVANWFTITSHFCPEPDASTAFPDNYYKPEELRCGL